EVLDVGGQCALDVQIVRNIERSAEEQQLFAREGAPGVTGVEIDSVPGEIENAAGSAADVKATTCVEQTADVVHVLGPAEVELIANLEVGADEEVRGGRHVAGCGCPAAD